jgi:hypothetical protein
MAATGAGVHGRTIQGVNVVTVNKPYPTQVLLCFLVLQVVLPSYFPYSVIFIRALFFFFS